MSIYQIINRELFQPLYFSLCGMMNLVLFYSCLQLVFNKTIGLKEDSGKNVS